MAQSHPIVADKCTAGAIHRAAAAFAVPNQDGKSGNTPPKGAVVDPQTLRRFVLTTDWQRPFDKKTGKEKEDAAYCANARLVIADQGRYYQRDGKKDTVYTIYNSDINHNKPSSGEGDQVWATFRSRWELLNFETDDSVRAKEQFPAVYFWRYRLDAGGNKTYDDNNEPIIDEYIICPGGRGPSGATKIIHVLDLHARKWSTSTFGQLQVSMANFGACIVENGYGEPELVCGSGWTEETDQNPLQFFNFEQEVWRKTNDRQSFAGCPVFPDGKGKAIIVGGQSAFYIGEKREIFGGSGGLTQYGWTATPLWTVDVTAGTVGPKIPLRSVNYSLVPVEREMAFMKTNFGAVEYKNQDGQKKVSYVAFGGVETVSAYNNAVVSYHDEAFVDSECYADRVNERTELFPDSPVPLGECAVVRINRISDGNGGMKPCHRVLCIGGRMRKQVEVEIERPDGSTTTETKMIFEPHEKVWSLELRDKNWIDDLFEDSIPIPRWNAPAVGVTLKREIPVDPDDPNNGQTQTVIHDVVFFIGGRNDDGLLADVDVLNLTTKQWETDWPDFNNKVRKQNTEENNG